MQPLAAILAAVLLATFAMAAGASPSAINATCALVTAGAYPGYDYCVNVLSDPSAAASVGLAVIAANATARNVTGTVGLIDDLLDTLPRCSDNYRIAMAEKVASALGELVAGRGASVSTYTLYSDAHDLGPLNCFMALTETWPLPGFPRPRDPLVHENNENMGLVLFAMNVAMLIPDPESSGSAAAAGASPAAIINATCSSLSYSTYPGYDYCVSVLSSGPSSATARDTRDLAIVATNAITRNITSMVELIQGLLSDVSECKISYGSRMAKAVDSALGDLIAGRDRAGAANKLADASRDAMDCDVVMSKRRGAAKNVLYQENADNFVSAHFASNVAMYSNT
jgi:pectinesterase inhibitor-like protein